MTITLSVTHTASPTTAVGAADVTGPDTQLINHINNILNAAQAFEQQLFTQIATPANPTATNFKIYVKSDGKVYVLNSSGTETLVGPAAASSSGDTFNMVRNRIFA